MKESNKIELAVGQGFVLFLTAHVIFILFFFMCSSAGAFGQYEVRLSEEARTAERFVGLGDYSKAFFYYKKALAGYKKQKNDPGIIHCLERMGWLQREIGEYGQAIDSFEKAYPIGIRLNGDAAEIDANLGHVYMFAGNSPKAIAHYDKALTALKDFEFQTSYDAPPGTKEMISIFRKCKAIIHARTSLGTLYYFSGDFDRSFEQLEIANELIEKIQFVANHQMYGMFFHPDNVYYEGIGYHKTFLATLYGETGRLAKAYQFFDAGLAGFEKAQSLFGRIVNQALRFKVELASPDFKLTDEKIRICEQFMEEVEKFGAQEVLWRMGFVLGERLIKEKKYVKAKKMLARSIESLEITRSRLKDDSLKKMFAASVQEVYRTMIELLFNLKSYEEGFDYLERSKARAFLDMLGGRSVKAQKTVEPELITKEKTNRESIEIVSRRLKMAGKDERAVFYKEYQRLLQERKDLLEAIKAQSLEYAATTNVTIVPVNRIADRLTSDDILVSYFLGESSILIWVVREKEISACRVNVGSSELADSIAEYREAVVSQQEGLAEEIGQELYLNLIDPIKARLSGKIKMFIVPSGVLNYFPFSALPTGSGKFLVQDHVINILPNASSLFFLDKEVTKEQKSLFAMGNPTRKDPSLSLAFAEKEVQAIAEKFKKKTLLNGLDAQETVLKNTELNGTAVIHFAAHGRYDAKQPLKSALLLAGDRENDGNLETFEIFGLTMNPKLVVLSACESGLGKLEGGDEVQSLNRAFLYAGAGGVLASLWKVPDQSTYKLMLFFYEELKTKRADEALRKAQMKLMNEYPFPYYWASFYLTGDIGN